jgi:PIN domain nuclease of toxin-antitoxin system
MQMLQDPASEVLLSAVSLWEISIKARLGKLTLQNLKIRDLAPFAQRMGMSLIPLEPEEAASQSKLKEDTHSDPFDRMLIWQAISRDLPLVSGDSDFQLFKPDGLKLIWK